MSGETGSYRISATSIPLHSFHPQRKLLFFLLILQCHLNHSICHFHLLHDGCLQKRVVLKRSKCHQQRCVWSPVCHCPLLLLPIHVSGASFLPPDGHSCLYSPSLPKTDPTTHSCSTTQATVAAAPSGINCPVS